MKTIYNKVYDYCIAEPRARYIKNRSRSVVNLLLQNYPELKEIPKDKLIDFIHDAESYSRAFRQVLFDNQDLVPDSDKKIKPILEQEKQIELGYTPHYQSDIKKLKSL